MQNRKFIINEYLTTILNNRVCEKQNGSSNFNTLNYVYNQKSIDYSLCVSIYLEHVTDHRQILAEQWILQDCLSNDINVQCGKFCSFEKKSLCCMLQLSPLKQNFLNKQHTFKNYQIQIVIEHQGKNQNLELYKCYHLNISDSLKIIVRFHQHLNLKEETNKQRSQSFQVLEIMPKQNNRLTRFNSDQIQTPEKKVFMYSFDEDVTFLIDENQAERLISQNSESDFMIQTIDEETDVTEWQVIDHKMMLNKEQKQVVASLKEIRNSFNSKSKHSHQIAKTFELIK